ncbi:30S ribosome-binding factor RbfA [Candidatus Babeliales bacterium]|nr:30S ribosome-binding factor RbfA [Candidatus Babeliales bacterium]
MKSFKFPLKTTRKRDQKTSLIFRTIASMIQSLSLDEPKISKVFVTRVRLSSDYKICYVYFSTYGEKIDFDEALEILKLYKPSMRKGLSKTIGGRYTPDLVFIYDKTKEKERHLNELLEKVSKESVEED